MTGKKKVKKKRKVNWREYNESLVRRGEVMFDTAFLGNWRAELRAMNKGKEGAKYVYPSSLIWLLAIVHTHIPASIQAAGRLPESDVHRHIKKLKVPDYTTTMHWRVVRVKVQLDPEVDPEKGVIIALLIQLESR